MTPAAPERALFAQLRRLDPHELRRVLIFVRGLLLCHGDGAAGEDRDPGVTFRLETVRCGKAGCRSCPHGPYWYAYYREGNRLRSRYIGRGVEGIVGAKSSGEDRGEGMSGSSD